MNDAKQDNDLDWENRVLCSDESCIGVIGADGRCKECGLPYQGELPGGGTAGTGVDAQEPPEIVGVDQAADPDEGIGDDSDDSADSNDEWDRRTLCKDESCIGVIGPDGRCKECGKPY